MKTLYVIIHVDKEESPYAETNIFTNWIEAKNHIKNFLKENIYLFFPWNSTLFNYTFNEDLEGLSDEQKFNKISKLIPKSAPKENIYDIFEKYTLSLPIFLNLEIKRI